MLSCFNCWSVKFGQFWGIFGNGKAEQCLYSLVEQDPGADDEFEDVFQGFHGFEELVSDPTLLSIVHVGS